MLTLEVRRLPAWEALMPPNLPSLGAYARTLAKPVARGLLPLCQAQAAVRVEVYRRARDGTLDGDGDPEGAYRFVNVLLDQHLSTESGRIAETGGRVKRAIKPLIALRRPVNAIRAIAHDINATDGNPLTEPEVDRLVTEQLYWAVQPPRRAR